MFGSNNNKREVTKTKSNTIIPSSNSHSLNSLVQGTVIEGAVKSVSDIRVDGTIKGKLICDSRVIIGPTGFVDGEIRCKSAVIEGKFKGNLEVAELLNVRERANISGEVVTNKLIVQSGAVFNVSCTMGVGKKVVTTLSGNGASKHSSSNKEMKGQIVKSPKPAGA